MHYTQPEVYEFVSKQTNDPIVEWKTCRVSGQAFAIYQSDLDFYAKISPSFGGKKHLIPTPTLCPEERHKRRLLFRNERKLYKRKCDASGEKIISIYPEHTSFLVYDQDVWWSDIYDPCAYGMEVDFGRSFFQQYAELLQICPKAAIQNSQSVNSAYTNYSRNNKDCYMCVGCDENQSCYHGYRMIKSSDCLDCYDLYTCQHCYECVSCVSCFACLWCADCSDCQYCFGCTQQKGQQYMIYNKQVSKEKYEAYMQTCPYIDQTSIEPTVLTNHVIYSEECLGNNLMYCKSCINSFVLKQCESCWYAQNAGHNTQVRDINYADNGEWQYDATNLANNYHVAFAALVWSCKYCYYCSFTFHSEHCFLCTGLKGQKYCILNKQYTKEAYEKLVPQIIFHMQKDRERGEFFDPFMSPFAYNETVAQTYYPLSRSLALQQGYTWQDTNPDPVIPAGVQTIQGDEMPRSGKQVNRTFLKNIIIGEVSGRPFRMVEQELDFYRKHNLPLPRKHPDVRHQERLAKRPGRSLYLRTCDCCSEEMLSVYAAGNQESRLQNQEEKRIYCESCYQREIYA